MRTEKEKCQAGELYDANNDAQLIPWLWAIRAV